MGGNKKKKSWNKNTGLFKITVAAFLVICAGIGILCFEYYRQLQYTIKNESSGYLQEISKQLAKNAGRVIGDNFAVLGTIGSVIKDTNVTTYEEFRPIVLERKKYWNYQTILLVDSSGNAHDENGQAVLLNNDEYLNDAVVNRKQSMSASQVINGRESVIFVIPLDGVTVEGITMTAIAVCYDLTTMDQILATNAFDGKGYAHIVKKDGSIVVRSSSKYAPQMGYNVLNSLERGEFDNGDSINRVRNDIVQNKSGMVGFKSGGVHTYMAYTPFEKGDWCLLGFVPVQVVNAKSQILMQWTLLLCGVITGVFALLFASLMFSSYKHKRKLEQIAFVDPITNGNTIQRFYQQAKGLLNAAELKQYALIYTNIEKFKILNEQFGRRICDGTLQSMQKGFNANLSMLEASGRLFADNFCLLVAYESEEKLLKRMSEWYSEFEKCQEQSGLLWLSPTVEFGVYIIDNDSLEFTTMIDRAKLALKEIKCEPHSKLRYAIYNDDVRKQLFREKQLEDMMEDSLKNREFKVYLQPKYRTAIEEPGGAEALVRWVSKKDGMIFPDEFIPLFEKNGFVVQLDLWVFEEVCLSLRRWLDEGKQPVKVSVNCSRIQLKNPRFLEPYLETCDRIGVPRKYIEIELTENVVFEDVAALSRIIDQIHEAGFGCSMDDFGSGYSSLNLIQDIPVDTIKLDKVFFRNGINDMKRLESVVGSILTMARLLNMETVAEGVEERAQVDMLKRLGCDYIQGYYFAKPMPIPDFEKLVFGLEMT